MGEKVPVAPETPETCATAPPGGRGNKAPSKEPAVAV